MTNEEINEAVRARLERPLEFNWSAHGIGMLRSYLDEERTIRLNLWHSRLVNRGITTMHTHERDFTSRILSGRLTNTIYQRVSLGVDEGVLYERGRISCGDRFKGIEEVNRVRLQRIKDHDLFAGMTYMLTPPVIHDTKFMDGTATVMEWGLHPPVCEAFVFWPVGSEWGDASRATTEEDVVVVAAQAKAIMGMRVKR